MKFLLFISILVCAFSCSAQRDAAKITDHESLQGVWLGYAESQNGITKEVSYMYVFKDDKITFTDETGREEKYSFKLDNTGKLKFIIIQPVETVPNSEPVSVGYELDGDLLKIVVAPSGTKPTEISDKNNQELITCKRKSS